MAAQGAAPSSDNLSKFIELLTYEYNLRVTVGLNADITSARVLLQADHSIENRLVPTEAFRKGVSQRLGSMVERLFAGDDALLNVENASFLLKSGATLSNQMAMMLFKALTSPVISERYKGDRRAIFLDLLGKLLRTHSIELKDVITPPNIVAADIVKVIVQFWSDTNATKIIDLKAEFPGYFPQFAPQAEPARAEPAPVPASASASASASAPEVASSSAVVEEGSEDDEPEGPEGANQDEAPKKKKRKR